MAESISPPFLFIIKHFAYWSTGIRFELAKFIEGLQVIPDLSSSLGSRKAAKTAIEYSSFEQHQVKQFGATYLNQAAQIKQTQKSKQMKMKKLKKQNANFTTVAFHIYGLAT